MNTNKMLKRRVKAKLRSDRTTALAANDIWAMDFVHDQLFDGTKIRALTIVDVLSRVSPAIGVRQSYRGHHVVGDSRTRRGRVRLSDDVKNLSQIWAVAPALVKLALRDDRRSQIDKEPPWKRIAKGLI